MRFQGQFERGAHGAGRLPRRDPARIIERVRGQRVVGPQLPASGRGPRLRVPQAYPGDDLLGAVPVHDGQPQPGTVLAAGRAHVQVGQGDRAAVGERDVPPAAVHPGAHGHRPAVVALQVQRPVDAFPQHRVGRDDQRADHVDGLCEIGQPHYPAVPLHGVEESGNRQRVDETVLRPAGAPFRAHLAVADIAGVPFSDRQPGPVPATHLARDQADQPAEHPERVVIVMGPRERALVVAVGPAGAEPPVDMRGQVVDVRPGRAEHLVVPFHGLSGPRAAHGEYPRRRIELLDRFGPLPGDRRIGAGRPVADFPFTPLFVADLPVLHAPRLGETMRSPHLRPAARAAAVHVLEPVQRVGQGAGSQREVDLRLGADAAAERDELGRAEAVVHVVAEVPVQTARAVPVRADAVLPLVRRARAPARPADDRRARGSDRRPDLPADTVLAGIRVTGVIQGGFDHPASPGEELPVDVGVDRPRGRGRVDVDGRGERHGRLLLPVFRRALISPPSGAAGHPPRCCCRPRARRTCSAGTASR